MTDIPNQVKWVKVFQNLATDLKVEVVLKALSEIIVKQGTASDLKALVSLADGSTIEVLQDTHGDLKADSYKPFPAIADLNAIEDVISEQEVNTNCSAGTNHLTFTAVPEGKIQIITNVAGWSEVGAPAYILIYAVIDGVARVLRRMKAPGENVEVIFNGKVILDDDDYIKVSFTEMLANDDIVADIVGYQIDKY